MPYLLNQWLQEEYTLGTAEPGERCQICRLPFLTREPVIVLRYRHPESDIRSMPISVTCLPCADRADGTPYSITVGPRGGRLLRASDPSSDLGSLAIQFWKGLRDNDRTPLRYTPSHLYWIMGRGYGARGGRPLSASGGGGGLAATPAQPERARTPDGGTP